MKKLYLFLALLVCIFHVNGQTEIKISPVPLLFGYVAASVEQAIYPSFGIDGDFYFIEETAGVNVSAKYYFNPVRGIDKFHVGAFVGAADTAPGVGFLIGYKWISNKNVVFELGGGVGRSFDDNILGYFKFHLGYRFNKKKKSDR